MKWTYILLCLGLLLTSVWGYGQNYDDTSTVSQENRYENPRFYYRDNDGDGYGTSDYTEYEKKDVYITFLDILDIRFVDHDYNVAYGCDPPIRWVWNEMDQDDTNSCITYIPPGYFYRDADGDGFGNNSISVFCSVAPSGYVALDGDCDDTDASVVMFQILCFRNKMDFR